MSRSVFSEPVQTSRSEEMERVHLNKETEPSESSNGTFWQSHYDRLTDKASEPHDSWIPASENDIMACQDQRKFLPQHSYELAPHECHGYYSSSSNRRAVELSKAMRAPRSGSIKEPLSQAKLEPMEITTEHGREDLHRLRHERDLMIKKERQIHEIQQKLELAEETIATYNKEVSSLKTHLADLSGKYEDGKQQTMAMRQQISRLQGDLVVAAKTEPHLLADDAIRERFRALCWRLDQWVRANVRTGRLERFKRFLPDTVDTLISVCPYFPSMEVTKGNLCVASAHWIFRDALTGTRYPGLPDEGPLSKLNDVEDGMEGTNVCLDEWRSMTYSAIKSTPNNDIVDASSKLGYQIAREVCAVLEDLTSVQIGLGDQFNELFSITQAALDLSQTLHCQRARFQVGNCYVAYESLAFNPEELERENADDPPSGRVQEYVEMIIMPCLYKTGDNFSKQSSYTGVVCKGKALARGPGRLLSPTQNEELL